MQSAIKLNKPIYSLKQAAKLFGCKVKNLLQWAANNELTLNVIADKWVAAAIYQFIHSVKPSAYGQFSICSVREMDTYSLLFEAVGTDDKIFSDYVIFGKQGIHLEQYEREYSDCLPIAPKCIKEYLANPDAAKIEIDLYKYYGMNDDEKDKFLVPNNELLLQDALRSRKVVVKIDDIKRLISSELAKEKSSSKPDLKEDLSASQQLTKDEPTTLDQYPVEPDLHKADLKKILDASSVEYEKKWVPEANTVKHSKGPKAATLALYEEWQKRADEKIKKNPRITNSALQVATLIYHDLVREKSKSRRSINTIRKHIEV